MKLPFLRKPVVKKITGDALGIERHRADAVIHQLLRALPELLAAAVVDVRTAKTLAAYTALPGFDPYKISGPNAELLRRVQRLLAAPWLVGQQFQDLVLLLDEQLHCLRTTPDGRHLCYVAVRLADTNLALVRDALRRAAS